MIYQETFYVQHEKRLCYFPIRKNASTTYSDFFSSRGWTPTDTITEDLYDYVWFAHIQEPRVRYVKGIAQVLDDADLYPSIHQQPLNQYIVRIYHDPHVNAISEQFGEMSWTINFLLLDNDSKQTTHDFLHKFGLEYPDLIEYKNQNVSRRRRRLLQDRVEYMLTNDADLGRIYNDFVGETYSNDRVLLSRAVENHRNWPYVITYAEYLNDRNTEVRIISEVKEKQEFNVWEAYGELLEQREESEEILEKPLWDRVKHAWKVVKG